jgi:uncharacterized protein YjiS (DUF1127 family)
MSRRLAADSVTHPRKRLDMRALRGLWRWFVAASLDSRPLDRFSSYQLRDIGLDRQSTSDGEEPWKRLK